MRDVRELVALESVAEDRFRSLFAQRNHRRAQFGGQLMALAIEAAGRSAGDRDCHAVTGHFLRAGDPSLPVDIAVERTFDGHSYCMRRASLSQQDRLIFQLEASFHHHEEGACRAVSHPVDVLPYQLVRNADLDRAFIGSLAPMQAQRIYVLPGIDIAPCDPRAYFVGQPDGHRSVWMRAPSAAGVGETTHRALLAHLTDFVLASTATLLQEEEEGARMDAASLNQSMWFHRAHPVDRWFRLDCDTPTMQNGRAIGRADLFDETGMLIASTVQELIARMPTLTRPT